MELVEVFQKQLLVEAEVSRLRDRWERNLPKLRRQAREHENRVVEYIAGRMARGVFGGADLADIGQPRTPEEEGRWVELNDIMRRNIQSIQRDYARKERKLTRLIGLFDRVRAPF